MRGGAGTDGELQERASPATPRRRVRLLTRQAGHRRYLHAVLACAGCVSPALPVLYTCASTRDHVYVAPGVTRRVTNVQFSFAACQAEQVGGMSAPRSVPMPVSTWSPSATRETRVAERDAARYGSAVHAPRVTLKDWL